MKFSPAQAFYQFKKHSGLAFVFTLCMYFFITGFVIIMLPLWLGWGGYSEMNIKEKSILTSVFAFFIVILFGLKKYVFRKNQIIVDETGFYVMAKGQERMNILKDDVWFFVLYPAILGIRNISLEKENDHFITIEFYKLLSILKKDHKLGIGIKPKNPEMDRQLSPSLDVKNEMNYYLKSLKSLVNEEEKEKAIALSRNIQPNFIYFDLREGALEWLAKHYPNTEVMVYKKAMRTMW